MCRKKIEIRNKIGQIVDQHFRKKKDAGLVNSRIGFIKKKKGLLIMNSRLGFVKNEDGVYMNSRLEFVDTKHEVGQIRDYNL